VPRTTPRRWLAAWLAVLVAVPVTYAANWPQWRGPTADGISPETNLPTKWDGTENVAWKLPLPGRGGSTPAVWGDRIFLTSEDNGSVDLICASTDGKEVWKRTLGKGGGLYQGAEGDDASPSPTTDGKHVYTFTGRGDMSCHDFDGKQVWHFNAQERYGNFVGRQYIFHGMHITPCLDGDRLYLSLLYTGSRRVFAFDKATGKEIWKIDRPSDARAECEQAYASPQVWRKGNEAYLVIHGNDYTTGHSLDDGKELWRVGDLHPPGRYDPSLRFVATPLVTPDLIVIASAKNGPTVAIDPTKARGRIAVGGTGELWRHPQTPDVSSPLLYDGLVYLVQQEGIWLKCLDAKTGKQYYEERLPRSRYRASPVYADGKLYIAGRAGIVNVVKAGPKFEMLATNQMSEDINSSPVIANSRIYIRTFKGLYAIANPTK
jgi:outer membrane protein assembly factor BamB